MAVVQTTFFAKTLKRQVSFSAIIPSDFVEIPNLPMPPRPPLKTIYLLHGYSGTHTDWLYNSQIQEFALFKNIAVIMPSGENNFYLDDTDRGELFGEFIGRELVDFSRDLFKLPNGREDTYIGGLSMGGYGAIRNGLKYHETFGGIVALSSALIYNRIATIPPGYTDPIANFNYYTRVFGDLTKLKGSDKDPEALFKKLKESGIRLPRLFMACGTEDFLLAENRELHAFLDSLKYPHQYFESQGNHNFAFWNEYIAKALDWLRVT